MSASELDCGLMFGLLYFREAVNINKHVRVSFGKATLFNQSCALNEATLEIV